MSLTLGMTAGADNDAIWCVRVTLDSSIIYYATRTISLDNTYLGNVLLKNSVAGYEDMNNSALTGGGIGQLGSFEFTITNFSGTFIDDFYPTASKPYFCGRKVELGVVWSTATLDSQITWLFEGYVDGFAYTPAGITVTVYERSELDLIELPPYKTQKDISDVISYCEGLDEEDLGIPIPIVYGKFTALSPEYKLWSLAPCILRNKTYFTYQWACHKCNATTNDSGAAWATGGEVMYKYIQSCDTIMALIPDTGLLVNDHRASFVDLLASTRASGEWIYGKLWLHPDMPGSVSEVNDLSAMYDREATITTSTEVADTSQVAVKISKPLTDAETGVTGTGASANADDWQMWVTWQKKTAGTGQIKMRYYDPIGAAYSTTNSQPTTTNTGSNWEVDSFDMGGDDFDSADILANEYVIENISGSSAAINIARIWFERNNLVVYRVLKKMPRSVRISYAKGRI